MAAGASACFGGGAGSQTFTGSSEGAKAMRLSGRSLHQRRAKFALTPCFKATPEREAPGSRQASTTVCLNSSACVRRLRRMPIAHLPPLLASTMSIAGTI